MKNSIKHPKVQTKNVDHPFRDDEKLASLGESQGNRVSGARTCGETSCFPNSTVKFTQNISMHSFIHKKSKTEEKTLTDLS